MKGLSKRYGEKEVLRNFSLELPQYGTVALLGPSGCGKTTLLRLLAGLEMPDEGELPVACLQTVSVVFQEDRLLETLRVRDNVAAVMTGDKADTARRADELLDEMGLAEVVTEYPAALSGGMRRRVAIARALAFGGELLLLDEPFKGLDSQTRSRVMAVVFAPETKKKRLTILVTHDRREARRTADVVYYLEGPPLRVVEMEMVNK